MESSVGSGESASLMSNGNSVQPSIAASHARPCACLVTCLKCDRADSSNRPYTSSSKVTVLIAGSENQEALEASLSRYSRRLLGDV